MIIIITRESLLELLTIIKMNTFLQIRNKLIIMKFKNVRTIQLTMAIDDTKMDRATRFILIIIHLYY